ncbi:hypothetical protein LY90DRAFT_678922 [Neocallimastix californiae]|uniref:Uncharacterized protein n=1 Tax=Neocallimastix californiae TaxID=1754190 RepID=A0A1Y1YE03_9FUNG|nr:hypothetical protein LY90DRAFT_678922 [Neocallimastix californiae]|eukprot:ORX96175.1 hypothetical protein LY90DRAFT_678922 [Neocallimastix californiae]
MTNKIEINTELFYKELKKENCNPEILLSLSKEGIFLSEPLYKYDNIKYHEYVIDISLENSQFIKIFNECQYNRFKKLIKKYYYVSGKYVILPITYLVILDEFFIKLLWDEKDEHSKIFKEYNYNIILYYFCKYNLISENIFNVFKRRNLTIHELIFIYFHDYFFLNDKNVNLLSLKLLAEDTILINIIVDLFGRNKEILEYIVKHFVNEPVYCYSEYFRIPLYYPYEEIKEYSKKIFKPNYLKFKLNNNKDDKIESQINTLFSDNFMVVLTDSKYYRAEKMINKYLNKSYVLDCDLEKMTEEYRSLISFNKLIDERCIKNVWHGINNLHIFTKNLYSMNFDRDILYNEDEELYRENADNFKKVYLTNDNIDKIFDNLDYIFSISSEYLYNYIYFIMIKYCIIIMLIQKKSSKFLISNLIESLRLNDSQNILHKNGIINIRSSYTFDYQCILDDVIIGTLCSIKYHDFSKGAFRCYYDEDSSEYSDSD